jgi:hypothetical protein
MIDKAVNALETSDFADMTGSLTFRRFVAESI